MSAGRSSDNIEAALLGEAADWLMRFQSGDDSAETRLIFEQWRAQSPAHAAAWHRAETVRDAFRQLPAGIGRHALETLAKPGRRRALQALGLVAVAVPAAWLSSRYQPWIEWTADMSTAVGEQKTLSLPDGTRLVVNTDSAVDVRFTDVERRLRLIEGEIHVATAQDSASRPFIVETTEGTLRPIGTRFSVRRQSNETQVAVFEGIVEISTAGGDQRALSAGERSTFSAGRIGAVTPVSAAAELWTQGMLVAHDMPLGTLIGELSRYHPGMLRCHPEIANLRVSGAFPLTDIDASLDLLMKTRPLAVRRMTRYWIRVEPLPQR